MRGCPGTPAFTWRVMEAGDLAAVSAIAARVHPGFPEDDAVLAEKRDLYPDGCRLLRVRGAPAGYVLSHPWTFGACPPLNARLGAIPPDASTFYIHDLALLPAARGTGAAGAVVGELKAHAGEAGLARLSLVAVNGSGGFWRRMGFCDVDLPGLAAKLASYGADARLMACALSPAGNGALNPSSTVTSAR